MQDRGRSGERLLAAVSLGIATWLLVWSCLSSTGVLTWTREHGGIHYYQRQTAGFAAGQLAMAVKPDPKVVGYGSDGRPAVEPSLLDASYYKGKYHLYFGPAPVLTLFLPVYVLTGYYVPEEYGSLFFILLGFWTCVLWMREWRRQAAPRSPAWIWAALILTAGLCTGGMAILRRPSFYEAAAASAYFWSMVALLAFTRGAFRPRHLGRWLLVGSFATGMAGASRVSLLPVLVVLPVTAFVCSRQAWKQGERRLVRLAIPWLSAGLPATAIFAGLLLFNLARFEHPLEFGFRFQVNGMPPEMFLPSWIPHNVRYYYFQSPQLFPYFPFAAPASDHVRPPKYWAYEAAHGQAYAGYLFIVLLLAVVWAWRRHPLGTAHRRVLGLSLLWFAVAFAPMAAAGVRANRYMLDFHPVLLGLFACAVLYLSIVPGRFPRLTAGGASLVLCAACVFNLFASFHSHSLFRSLDPNNYYWLERRFNQFAWPVLKWFSDEPGARQMHVVFPPSPAVGSIEPLFVSGVYTDADGLLIQYLTERRARLLFNHEPWGQAAGPVFTLPESNRAVLALQIGTFYPPVGHPWWGSRSKHEQVQLLNTVRVVMDGKKVLDLRAACHSSAPNRWTWGERNRMIWSTPVFTGEIERIERGPEASEWIESHRDPSQAVRLRLLLPQERYTTYEPLASIGRWPRSELVCVQYLEPGAIKLAFISRGVTEWSPRIEINYSAPHEFVIERTGSAAQPETAGYRYWVDGTVVWSSRSTRTTDDPLALVPLSNTVGETMARGTFGGETLVIDHVPQPSLAELDLPPFEMPDNVGRQPLVGVQWNDGTTSTLWIQRADARGALLSWESEARPADTRRIQLNPLVTPRLRLQRDGSRFALFAEGRELWSSPRDESREPRDLRFWTDASRAQTASVALLPNWTADTTEGEGPLLLTVKFPRDRTGQAEPLVVTGSTGSGDAVYVKYLNERQIVIGADHWGAGGPVSQPIDVDYTREHEVWISMTSLYRRIPAENMGVSVWLDGREVLSWGQPGHGYEPDTLKLGENAIGMSTQQPTFTGEILHVRRQLTAPAKP